MYAAYKEFTNQNNIKNTSKTCEDILTLPLFPSFILKHQDKVINYNKKFGDKNEK